MPITRAYRELYSNVDVEVVTANKTLTASDSNKTFFCATDGVIFSLPATIAGLRFTIVNTAAAGAADIAFSPVAADGIFGKITLAAGVVVKDGTVNVDAVNTQASSIAGDSMTVLGTGVTGVTAFHIENASGIWA